MLTRVDENGEILRRCNKCDVYLSGYEFPCNKDSADGLGWKCRGCKREEHLRHYEKQKERIKRRVNAGYQGLTSKERKYKNVRHCYGLTAPEYDALVAAQLQCQSCKRVFSDKLPSVIDHCHATGVVRGLLCHGCNIGIGYFREDPEAMRAAAIYIESCQSSRILKSA